MFKRFLVLDLFDQNEAKDTVEWVESDKELPKVNKGIYWVRLGDGSDQRAYYCRDKCEMMMRYFEGKSSYWWSKREGIPLHNVTHWGKVKEVFDGVE